MERAVFRSFSGLATPASPSAGGFERVAQAGEQGESMARNALDSTHCAALAEAPKLPVAAVRECGLARGAVRPLPGGPPRARYGGQAGPVWPCGRLWITADRAPTRGGWGPLA